MTSYKCVIHHFFLFLFSIHQLHRMLGLPDIRRLDVSPVVINKARREAFVSYRTC